MFNYKNWIVFFFTVIFLVPLSFFAGLVSLKILLLAPFMAVGFLHWIKAKVPQFFLDFFDAEELPEDLKEALLVTAKIALAVHRLDFELKIFQNVEAQAFAIRGFKGERLIFLSSGLVRSASEVELRELFVFLRNELNDPVSSWVALYTVLFLFFLPRKQISDQTPWGFWVHLFKVSLSRLVIQNIPTRGKNGAISQFHRFSSVSHGDFVFLSPLFQGPKVSREYGSLESTLIRE